MNLITRRISVLTILFLLIVNYFPGYAQNKSDQERKQLFDYDWKFILADEASASSTDFNDAGWRSLDLPHDWSIEGKIKPKNPSGGAGAIFLPV